MPRSPWAIEPREAVSGCKKRHATRRRVPTDPVRDSYVIIFQFVENQWDSHHACLRFSVVEVVCQPGQLLLLHGVAAPAIHAPDLDLQVHPSVATREVAYSTSLAIVERSVRPSTRSTGRFFPRRWSRKIRALGSPKMPRTVASGRKPGNRNVSSSLRGFCIRES